MFARKHMLRWLTTPYRQPDPREVEKCSGSTGTKNRPYQEYAGSFAAPPDTPYATHAACLRQYVYIEYGSKTTKTETISA